MNNSILEQFEELDVKTLSDIRGSGYGVQCILGTAGGTIMGGALFGPGGAAAGFAGGSTAFCYDTVS
ncbi:ComC/BlpC family leader-containing pheromone/bacteriocin [Streptococcus caviae]|uniref:ComC/BlpC family leader-containing pheromone/bacteriocin n=1 Tax=Streptococcus sp. 'caviae' TaxID=1915004 RepID=UPI00094BB358|nr:Blp family class II bacteriocin [Streptococcus sp. 'caviae']OLN83180.1 bacteriocin BlpI [Streptococcus sp. 'caviae']